MGTYLIKYFKNSQHVGKAVNGAIKFLKVHAHTFQFGKLKKSQYYDEVNKKIIDKRAYEMPEYWK
jgi:hypothetical protein